MLICATKEYRGRVIQPPKPCINAAVVKTISVNVWLAETKFLLSFCTKSILNFFNST